MIRLFIAFLVLLGSIYLGVQLNKDPGYVLISFNHWTIETTLWVFLFSLIFFFALIYIILRISNKIIRAPKTFQTWHEKRLEQKAQETTRKGFIEYTEGYWQKAKKHVLKALPNTDTPLLNYLTAAGAAQQMGESKLRDDYLRQAQQAMPEAKIAIELTQAQLQLANNQLEQALATLRHLQDLAPHHPYVLKLLMRLYEKVGDWKHLISLLPMLRKYKVVPQSELLTIEQQSYINRLKDLIKLNQTQLIDNLFTSRPKSLAQDVKLIELYAQYQNTQKHTALAEELVRSFLKKDFDSSLIELYGLIDHDDHQLKFAESLLKKQPHSAPLYLCLGRLCLRQHLWGKAKNYLEQSIKINPTPMAYLELGKLHEQLNESFSADEAFKKGLELATSSL